MSIDRNRSVGIRWAACLIVAHLGSGTPLWAEPAFELDRRDDLVEVRLDGSLFTRYLVKSQSRPILWPIIGPSGQPMTRAYPMRDQVSGEVQDHPHQRSFWFSHGDVNGIDFWSENKGSGTIEHMEFVRVESRPLPVIQTRNEWRSDQGEKVCSDVRMFTFGASDAHRWIDFDITVYNDTQEDVVFGDTKEGTFGIRVAESMKVDSGSGGEIVNSLGARGTEAWGQTATWVDYHGTVEGEIVGIAVLNHPNSFRFPTYWHVRRYGLLAANVFGLQNFKNSREEDGSHRLKPGESISFFYRVILHRGDEQDGRIPEAFANYVKTDKPLEGIPISEEARIPLVPQGAALPEPSETR